QGGVDRVDDLRGGLTLAAGLFGNVRHAVVGPKRQDIAVTAETRVEVVEQFPDRLVEAQQHVLDLVALRSVLMSDEVEGGEADAEKVGPGAAPEVQRVDGVSREASEILVGKRAPLP